jgi:hypothetical protein
VCGEDQLVDDGIQIYPANVLFVYLFFAVASIANASVSVSHYGCNRS